MKKVLWIIVFTFTSSNAYTQCQAVIGSSIDPLEGCEVLTIQFFDQSTNVLSRTWNFGDGSATSQAQNPLHSFDAGIGDTTYTVTLTITCPTGTSSTTKTVQVFAKPKIIFESDKTSVCAITDSICFTNTSDYHAMNSYSWNFGDGTISGEFEPCKTYSTPGTYSSSLTVINQHGCLDTETKDDYITVEPVPSTAFSVSEFSGCSPFNIIFKNTTDTLGNDYSNWTWDFGDGSPNILDFEAPPHTYNIPGEYTVTFGATNSLGCYNYSSQIITVKPSPIARFEDSAPNCQNENTSVQFTGTYITSPTFSWDFDSAAIITGTGEGPYELQWTNPGIKDVSLTVIEDGCSSVFTKEVQITPISKVYLHISASEDTICSDETVVFTASPVNFVNYSFFVNYSLVQSSSLNTYEGGGFLDGDNIFVKITDINGCSEIISDTVTIHVKETPVVTLASSALNDTVCFNDPVVFTASPDNYDIYDFYQNNELLQSSSSNIYTPVSLSNKDRVYVKAINKECESDISNIILTTVKEQLPAPEVYCGTSTSSSIEFVWDPVLEAIEYEISIDNGPFVTPDLGILALSQDLTGLAENESHTISVRGIDGSICGTGLQSEVVTCEAKSCLGIEYDLSQAEIDVCEGEYLQLSVENINISSYSVEWNNEGVGTDLNYYLQAENNIEIPVNIINLTEPQCPSVEKNFLINVTPKRQITITSSVDGQVICENQPVVFTVSPADLDLIDFYDNGLLVQSGVENTFRTGEIEQNHNFYAKVQDEACQLYSDTISIEIEFPLETPVVNVMSSTENSVTFIWDEVPNATGYVVSYNDNDFIFPSSGATGLTHTVSPLNPGDAVTLAVIALGEGSCGNSDMSQPAIGFAENCMGVQFDVQDNLNLCSGDSVRLEISDLSISDYEISWGLGPFTTNKIAWVKPVKDTVVSVFVINTGQPNCPGVIKYIDIQVEQKPGALLLSSSDPDDVICLGEHVTFTATPGGFDNYEFYSRTWIASEGPYNTYDIIGEESQYEISARALNGNCAGEFSNQIITQVVPPLNNPQVNCGNTSINSISFTWDSIPDAQGYLVSINESGYFNPSSGSMGLIHEVTGLSAGDSLSINVIALGDVACTNSMPSITTTCHAQDCNIVNYKIEAYHDVCQGEDLTLNVSDISIADYSISWNNQPFVSDTTQQINAIKDTVISVRLKDNSQPLCPTVNKQFEIDVREILPVSITTNTDNDSICFGERLRFTVLPTGFERYVFYNQSSVVQDTVRNTYSSDKMPSDNSVYAEVYQNGCLSQTETVHIEIVPLKPLNLTASQSGTICLKEEVDFTFSSGFVEYILNNGYSDLTNTSQNTLTLAVSDTLISGSAVDEHGCISVSSDTISFNLLPLPKLSLSCSEDTVCFGEFVNYSVSPSNLIEYQFYNHSQLLVASPSSFYSTDSLKIGDRISVVGTDINGCQSPPNETVYPFIHPYPQTEIISEYDGICLNDTVYISFIPDPLISGVNYYWSTGETTDSIKISPQVPATYDLFFSNAACTHSRLDSKFIMVDRDPPPVANAGDDVIICIYDSIQLEGSGGLNYLWSNPESLDSATVYNPFAFPTVTTNYALTVTNSFCKSTDTVQVYVDLCLEDLTDPIPQIISPNGDGINDVWEVNHVDYFEDNSLEIFNRWGNLVYTAKPYDNTWDGKSNSGIDLPDGTYFYVLKLGIGTPTHTGYIIIHR